MSSIKDIINTVFILWFITECSLLNGQVEQSDVSDKFQVHCAKNYGISADTRTAESGNYDLIYARMQWEVDPNVQYVKGVVTYDFSPTKEDVLSIQLDCNKSLEVHSILFEQQVLQYNHRNDDVLEVLFPSTLRMDSTYRISIEYEGIPTDDARSFVTTIHHDTVPILWTLSEPFGSKSWWPSKLSLDDKIDSIDVIVSVPKGNIVASNGVLISELEDNDRTVFHWKHTYPITTYLVAIAVTNYARYIDVVTFEDGYEMAIHNYVYPQQLEQAKEELSETIEQMKLFSQLFGPYPFRREKYGNAQFGYGGGMEHQTMSFMGSYSFGLQAHELAHQWFGNKITCGSWQDIWLNESFATYLTGLSYEFLHPEDWMEWRQVTLSRASFLNEGSIYVPTATDRERIFSSYLSYAKGAYVLHMLRWEIGDEAFFSAIRNYLTDEELAYGYARTEDIQRHFERTSNRDLQQYFDDWIYGEGYPIYVIQKNVYFDKKKGNSQVDIKMIQRKSTERMNFIPMRIPVRFIGRNGRDTSVILHQIKESQIFSFELPFELKALEFDPELHLLAQFRVLDGRFGQDNPITVVPNPVIDNLNLYIKSHETTQTLYVDVYNVNGKRMIRMPAEPHTEIDVSQYPSGIYIIRLSTMQEYFSTKFIVP